MGWNASWEGQWRKQGLEIQRLLSKNIEIMTEITLLVYSDTVCHDVESLSEELKELNVEDIDVIKQYNVLCILESPTVPKLNS